MSLSVPLGIRLKTSRTDRRVTNDVRGVTFRTIAPGGFASASIVMERPLRIQPSEIATFGSLYIYDTTSGVTVWEGRVEDLGRTSDSSGQIWEINALGSAVHAQDMTRALYYSDNRLDAVKPSGDSYKATEIQQGDTPNDRNGITEMFPRGIGVTTGNERCISVYNELADSGLKIAVVHAGVYSGFTPSSTWLIRTWVRPVGGGAGSRVVVQSASPVAGDMGTYTRYVGTDWSGSYDQVTFEFQWGNGTNNTVGTDTTWVTYYDIVMQQVRMDAAGNELLTAASYSANTVAPHQIVNDLLGRLLPKYNGINASVDVTSAAAIEQFSYPDGASPDQVLTDLMNMIGTHLWEALETDPDTGKWRFNWRPWPTTVRYEATVKDGYTSPISADELYNEVAVRYTKVNGLIRTIIRTQTVPALSAASLTRTGFIDLGDVAGTLANAQAAGDAFLADHLVPDNKGTLTIRRRILDRLSGRYVDPWEIRPGYLIRIRGVEPELDWLNPIQNGSSVCRVVSVEYSDTDNSAVLELDAYSVEQSKQIATLKKRLENRIRR